MFLDSLVQILPPEFSGTIHHPYIFPDNSAEAKPNGPQVLNEIATSMRWSTTSG